MRQLILFTVLTCLLVFGQQSNPTGAVYSSPQYNPATDTLTVSNIAGATSLNGATFQTVSVDLTGQTTALGPTTLFTPTVSGLYRISVYEKVMTAATSSSSLGGAAGTTIAYTDASDSVAQSMVMALQTSLGTTVTTSSGNLPTTKLTGTIIINAVSGTPITYAIGYTSSGATAMAYELHIKLEAL